MTELHFDQDELGAILVALIDRRDRELGRAYHDYLDRLVLKVGAALNADGQGTAK